jgi:hypothetical protein
MMPYFPVTIPTNHQFLQQQYQWFFAKVAKHFKRNKERVLDTTQNVRVRWLAKDGIGRWFFKWLTDELVDRVQAERILGGYKSDTDENNLKRGWLTYIGSLNPVHGLRTDENSLWRVSDLLKFAKFDYERYYYSIQNHTIDSDQMLQLLGYPAGQYSILQSMWRQGRILPSELTKHKCPRRGKKGVKPQSCKYCKSGLASLRARKLTVASKDDWNSPELSPAAAKLRWDDSQLAPFLRDWRHSNIVKCTPTYIMREGPNQNWVTEKQGINAGLYKYARMLVDNEVVNDFKRITRSDDISTIIFNDGISPEISDEDTVAWESDENDENPQIVFRDTNSASRVSDFEINRDLDTIIRESGLTQEEEETVRAIDLGELTAGQYSRESQRPVQRIHRVRAAAIQKMRKVVPTETDVELLIDRICKKHDCTILDIKGSVTFGPCVKARTDLYSELYDAGWTISSIACYFETPEERVVAAINRRVLHEIRNSKQYTSNLIF